MMPRRRSAGNTHDRTVAPIAIRSKGNYPPRVTELEAAWDPLWEAMPARWTVGRPSFDPGARAWLISAVPPDRGRAKIPASLSGRGNDEVAAIRDLDARLRGERTDGPRKLGELRATMRMAYLAGAEGWSRAKLGRGLTASELAGVIARFPNPASGDLR